MTRVEIVAGDLTRQDVDAIVNAANTSLLGGGGVDGAIHRAGGPEILEQCRAIVARQGGCKVGEAVITGGGRLVARHVIHTVGPVWNGGDKGEREKLARCWTASLELAVAKGLRTVAFPAISTGVYRFPMDEAAKVSLAAVRAFVAARPGALDVVRVVLWKAEDVSLWQAELR